MIRFFHSISTALLLCIASQAFAQQKPAFTPPDPSSYGARLEAGDVSQARSWLDAGLDPEYMAEHIGTGLMIGAWRGDIPMMELFVSRGADINRANALGERALMHAAWRGNREAVLWLIARGAQVNSEPMRWSPLHYAVFAGHGELTKVLLEMGADINARSTNGSSVLMMAVYEGHDDLVKELLRRGADTGIRNDRGDGPLEWAFKFQRLGIARMVSNAQEFAAAANRPKADWGESTRSVPKPAAVAPVQTATSARLEELMRIRETLVARGMPDAVAKIDRRISDQRAKEAADARAPSVSLRQGRPLDQLDEMEHMRDILASRGMKDAVSRLDRRIAAMRAQRARADMDVPTTVLEISARRGAPNDQEMRLLNKAAPP